MTKQQEKIVVTLTSKEEDDHRIDDRNKKTKEIEQGLDFILSHLEEPTIFPRTIMTKKIGYQRKVYSKERAIDHFIKSDFVDCRINAFPSLKEDATSWSPNLLFIDLDLKSFKSEKSLQLVLDKTRQNIKEKVDGYPTVLKTGGGYHIYQPLDCSIALENIRQFNGFEEPSQEFLRFAKDNLSKGKADKNNNPSFRSCLLRIPGSINSKYDKKVEIVQEWNGVRLPIPIEFMEEFRSYLIQKRIDESEQRQKILLKIKASQNNIASRNYYEWIESKILTNPFPDCRKIIVDLILAPYLINIKKMSYVDSYQTIRKWLDKCNSLQKLDNYNNFVNYRIHSALKTAMQKGIGPMSLYKIKTDNRYRNNLYLLILQNKKQKNYGK